MRARWTTLLLMGLLLEVLVPSASALPGDGGDVRYWPDSTWQARAPGDAGFDEAALQAVVAHAERHGSTGLLVLRGGHIVAEHYWRGTDHASSERIFSTSKGLLALLVGTAIDDGHIASVQVPVARFVTAWQGDARRDITLEHLLSMTSGLDGARDRRLLLPLGRDAFAAMGEAALLHAPGTRWEYHTPAYRLLARILEDATGESIDAYGQRRLFGPIGATSIQWDSTPARGGRRNHLFMRSNLRDLGRVGLLVLRQGQWRAQRLLSADFVARALAPSQALNPSYGWLWWRGGEASYIRPGATDARPGPMWPACPRDAVGALGANDKKLYVVPSLDLVVVRLGEGSHGGADPAGVTTFDNELLGGICMALGYRRVAPQPALPAPG